MAAQPVLPNSTLKTIENEEAFARGIDLHVFNHGSGDFPALLRNVFPGNDQLVEVHGPDLSKFNIQTQAGADVGIVWTQRPNEILMKCAGGTPSVRKKATFVFSPFVLRSVSVSMQPVYWARNVCALNPRRRTYFPTAFATVGKNRSRFG